MKFNQDEYLRLKGRETGEAFNIKASFKWILHTMPYDDFVKFAKLTFIDKMPGHTEYKFTYSYLVTPEWDTPAARENYIKYLFFKLYQNLTTDGIELV